MSLITWMPTLADKIEEVAGLEGGVRYTPRALESQPGLPAAIGEFPIALIVPSIGLELNYASKAIIAEHTAVVISLYTAQGFLPEAADIAIGFIDKIQKKLAASYTLDGTVSHIEALAPWWEGPAGLEYAGELYTGINFFYTVKEKLGGNKAIPLSG